MGRGRRGTEAPGTGPQLCLPPGLYTAYTAHLHRDKALFKRLLGGLQKKRPPGALAALLRTHLLELTQSFVIPLVRPRAGRVGQGCCPRSLPSPPQEHYMASLMPLQKSVTPWKVGSGSTWPSGRGWTQVGSGGVPVLIPEERGRGCARAPRAPGFPTRSGCPFQAREVGTRSSLWNLSQAGWGPRSVTGWVLASGAVPAPHSASVSGPSPDPPLPPGRLPAQSGSCGAPAHLHPQG